MFLIRSVSAAVVISGLLLMMFLAVACGRGAAGPTAAPVATVEPAATEAPVMAATEAPTAMAMATMASMEAMPTDPAAAMAAGADATAAPADAATAMPATSMPATPDAPAAGAGAGAVFTLGEGTVARYKVEEVLANTGFKVATGETMEVAGSIVFDADGGVVGEESRIAVQAATLETDSGRRDGYVRRRTLETDAYPEVVFQPTAVEGLPGSIAEAMGPAELAITGDLTVKDQTREVTWEGSADFTGDGTASGSVAVEFTFEDFGMDKPSVAIVLSVEETIRLELDFVGMIGGR